MVIKMLIYELINKENMNTAIKIQNTLFPNYKADINYIEFVNGITNNLYYIVKKQNEELGIYGLYEVPSDSSSAWLGWFGVLEKFRKKGYGREIINHFENEAREKGYKFARFYTDKEDNDAAISFYTKLGYSFEDYSNEDDPAGYDYPLLIGSKSLCDESLIPWNNRNIEITSQIYKQNGYAPKLLETRNLDDVTLLYEKCFLNNHYFLEQFKGKNLKEIMDTLFREMFDFCIKEKKSFGLFDGQKLIGFYLCFDFYKAKEENIREFNNIFTCDYDNYDYPYKEEFHSKVDKLKKPIMYLLALCIDSDYRGKGLSNLLLNNYIIDNYNYTLISDVTSEILFKSLTKKKFKSFLIDDDYYLFVKEKK